MSKVARRIGITKARQLPLDRMSEMSWIQKESRIR